jgi:peptidyl-prolyl cis-trans isomerase SurA
MRRALQFGLLLVLIGSAACTVGGEVIDRILAIVNSKAILQSDWEEALRCEALLQGRTPESLTEIERKGVFDRLIDQVLVLEQMRSFNLPPIPEQEIQQRKEEVRKQLQGSETAQGWQATLERDGVSEEEVSERLRSELEILKFLDARFRTGIRIDNRTVTRYYNEHYLPELRKAGAKDVPLNEVRQKIREILVQERLNELTSNWLQTLREAADIRYPNAGKTESSSAGKTAKAN